MRNAEALSPQEESVAPFEAVSAADLLPADVILSYRPDWISRAIRFFDGSGYSHASLYVGAGTVVELLARGIVQQGLEASRLGAERVLIRRLKANVPTLDPIVDRARQLAEQGQRYIHEPVISLAFLCLTRKVKATPVLRHLVRRVLEASAAAIGRCLEDGHEPVLSSELVYRCFQQAVPEAKDLYAIEINTLPGTSRGLAAAPGHFPGFSRGRGVHADSLLAWRLSTSARSWNQPPRIHHPSGPQKTVPPTLDEIEGLVQRYFAEVRGEALPGVVPAVADETLIGAIDAFALAVRQRRPGGELGGVLAGEIAAWGLFDTQAHFVTPGDLYQTESLFTLGPLR
jgi:hypothetical protein